MSGQTDSWTAQLAECVKRTRANESGLVAVVLCPSTSTTAKVGHRPPICHPERTRISYFAALTAATYAALRKESRMKSTEATDFDRKSGAAEGSAVRPGSRTKVSVLLVVPQNRHPACPGLPWERSASQIDRVTRPLLRGVEEPVLSVVEGTSAVLNLPTLRGAFRPPKSDHRMCCDTHLFLSSYLYIMAWLPGSEAMGPAHPVCAHR
jgi:hypothetical protein